MEERLWNYIDGLSSPEERIALEGLMASDRALRDQYAELLSVHTALHGSELEVPSMRFTKNVMEAIARQSLAPAATGYINKYVIRAIAGFLLVLFAGVLAYALVQARTGTTSSSFHLPAVHINPALLTEKNKLFSGAYTSVFMLVVVVSGLVLLDIFVLRRKANKQDQTSFRI
jgi:late competence protein required for DNA uptake (superfamily II DNA/RNA helicase)